MITPKMSQFYTHPSIAGVLRYRAHTHRIHEALCFEIITLDNKQSSYIAMYEKMDMTFELDLCLNNLIVAHLVVLKVTMIFNFILVYFRDL